MCWRRKVFGKFAENPDLDGIKFKFEPDNKHDKYAAAIKFRGKLSAADWARLLPVFESECIRYCCESDGIGWRLRFRAKLKKLGSPVGLPEIFIPEEPSKRGRTIMIY